MTKSSKKKKKIDMEKKEVVMNGVDTLK